VKRTGFNVLRWEQPGMARNPDGDVLCEFPSGGDTRVAVNPSHTLLVSPDLATGVYVEDASTYIEKSGIRRVDANVEETQLRSDNETQLSVGTNSLQFEQPGGARGFRVDASNVHIGTAAGGYTLPLVRGALDEVLVTDASGVVTWQPRAPPARSFGSYYFQDNVTTTVVTVIDVDYPVTGTYIANAENVNFDIVAPDRLRYTGATTHCFMFSCTLSVSVVPGQGDAIKLAITKNSVEVPGSAITVIDDTLPQVISLFALVELSQNDYVQVTIANKSDTSDVLVADLQLVGTQVS
jgi:hypothetical protein